MKKNNTTTTYEVVRKIRGDWGAVNPITKVIPQQEEESQDQAQGKGV